MQKNCLICSRLSEFRVKNRKDFPDFFNNPVPSFGDINAEFLIVGLAPGLKGANATGRPFTNDFAGDILYPALIKYNFAIGEYLRTPADSLQLINTRITNAVRCVPPENKPTACEQDNCRVFLKQEIESMNNLKVILTLGQIAHNNIIKCFNLKLSKFPFQDGKTHQINNIYLVNSYHTSRYNINTNRLSLEMFEKTLNKIKNIFNKI